MRVFMKPSNSTFGTKLFVSLVLLAISLCLVRCAGDKLTPVTVEEKELTVTSAALASKITQILGKKVPVKQPAALYEGFKLEEIIPDGAILTTFKPSQVKPAKSDVPITEYEFAIPAGKTIKDYVQAALKDFTTEGKTKEQIKDDLKARFDKTSADYGIKNEEKKITIQMTVPELEKFFYENFKDEKKIEQLPSTSPAQTLPANDKGLFASMFGTATPLFDFTVYVPKNSGTSEYVKAFCKACVDAVTTATTTPAPALADANAAHKALLNQVLTSLKAPKDADVEAIKYSVLIKGFEEYGFNATNKKIEAVSTTGTTAFTADNFKYADIVKPETFLNKFFYSFGEFDSTKSMPRNEILLDYLLEVNKNSTITGTNFQDALSKLLKAVETDLADTSSKLKKVFKAADPNAINFFLRSIKISKDELQKSMEEIAVAKFQFKVAPEDIKVPTEKTPFTAVTGSTAPTAPAVPTVPSVKCAKFPRKSTDTALADIDLIKSYVEFVVKLVDEKKKSEVDFSKDAHDKIKTEFFKAFWDEAVFAEYGKQLLTPPNTTTTPDGGEGNGQGGSQQGDNTNTKPEKEGLSNLTIILICIGGAAVLIAIALGIYYKFYAGKESSEL